MSSKEIEEPMDQDELWLTQLVKESDPNGPDDPAFWNALERHNHFEVSPDARARAIAKARIAIAITRGELTVGTYLARLRAASGLDVDAVARESRVAPEVVSQLETGRKRITAVAPERLAHLAVLIGAGKQTLLDLTRAAAASFQPTQTVRPSLFRTSSIAKDEDNGESQTVDRPVSSIETYLGNLSNAFDAELERSRQS